MKLLLWLYFAMLATLPLVHAFAVNFIFNIPVMLSILIGMLFIFSKHDKKIWVPDFLLIILWVVLLFGLILRGFSLKATNHMFAYTAFLIFSYSLCKQSMYTMAFYYPDFFRVTFKILSWMLFVTCVVGIVDWYTMNFAGFELPFPRAIGGNAGYALTFQRARSFLGEPSFLANFILAISPICIWYVTTNCKNILVKIIFLLSVLTAFLLTFSVKNYLIFACLLPLVVCYFLFRKGVSMNQRVYVAFIASTLVVLFIWLGGFDFYESIVSRKFFGTSMYNERIGRGAVIFEVLSGFDWFFGHGPASYIVLVGKEHSFLSGYAFLLGDSGIFGIILYMLFMVWNLRVIIKLPSGGIRLAFLCSWLFFLFAEFISPEHYRQPLYILMALLHVLFMHKSKVENIFPSKYIQEGV